MLSIIVAISEENAIGKQGGLLCHLPNDLKHFKEITTGGTVIMGERTYISLPRRPLPNRYNIVITDQPSKTFEGAQSVYSIDEALEAVQGTEKAFVIGGGSIYRQMMPYADRLYITHIHHHWEDADTFFPEIESSDWIMVNSEEHRADEQNPYDYTFAEYERKRAEQE